MPWGGEGTKGSTDQKEGFYGGPELNPMDHHPLKGIPTYGKNQFPDEDVPEMRKLVLEYIGKVTELELAISDAMSVGLSLERTFVRRMVLEPEPIQLFRAFKYSGREGVESCGIGEHSDFGFLTILSQNAAGLQVFSPSDEWGDVPVIPDSFVVNGGHSYCATLTCFIANPHPLQSAISWIVSLLDSISPHSTASSHRRPRPSGCPFHSSLIPLGQLQSNLSPSPPLLTAPTPMQRHSNAGNNVRRSVVSRVFGDNTLV
jgi:hypothetical protein